MSGFIAVTVLVYILEFLTPFFLLRFVFSKFGVVYGWKSVIIDTVVSSAIAYILFSIIEYFMHFPVISLAIGLLVFGFMLDVFSKSLINETKKRRVAIATFLLFNTLIFYGVQSLYFIYLYS